MLSQLSAAAARAFLSSRDGIELLNYLRLNEPLIEGKDNEETAGTANVLKGYKLCIKQMLIAADMGESKNRPEALRWIPMN